MISPHGSAILLPKLLNAEPLLAEQAKAKRLTTVAIASQTMGDLLMLGMGGFTPLNGFMNQRDWHRVCLEMRTETNLFWPIPITLSIKREVAHSLKVGQEITLSYQKKPIATLEISEIYKPDIAFECVQVYKTTDSAHPGVLTRIKLGEYNIAGAVKVISMGAYPKQYPDIFLTPQEVRAKIKAYGWKTVAAFQTRNPMHRAHEYCANQALAVCDGLLIHSILGRLKPGDLPASVRIKAINALIRNYFDEARVFHAGYPLDMRYAGPREALLHALFRQNFGCTHFIVGRDHAGVGQYYAPYEAQQIFENKACADLGIKILKMDAAFWCYACHKMTSQSTCPHSPDKHLNLSGTKLREKLSRGEPIEAEFSRPEVLAILKEYYSPRGGG